MAALITKANSNTTTTPNINEIQRWCAIQIQALALTMTLTHLSIQLNKPEQYAIFIWSPLASAPTELGQELTWTYSITPKWVSK